MALLFHAVVTLYYAREIVHDVMPYFHLFKQNQTKDHAPCDRRASISSTTSTGTWSRLCR
jgi:hypothetical protein